MFRRQHLCLELLSCLISLLEDVNQNNTRFSASQLLHSDTLNQDVFCQVSREKRISTGQISSLPAIIRKDNSVFEKGVSVW